MVKFQWRSTSQIWIQIVTLVSRVLAEVCTVPVLLVQTASFESYDLRKGGMTIWHDEKATWSSKGWRPLGSPVPKSFRPASLKLYTYSQLSHKFYLVRWIQLRVRLHVVHDVMACVADFASGVDQVLSRLSQKNSDKSIKFHILYEHRAQIHSCPQQLASIRRWRQLRQQKDNQA